MRVAHRRQWAPDDTRGLSPDYVAIIAALRKIPPRQRQAIVLHHLVGLSVEEIARETGAAAGTVKARLSRGRQAMAPYLADSEPALNRKPGPDAKPGPDGKPGLNGTEVACDA